MYTSRHGRHQSASINYNNGGKKVHTTTSDFTYETSVASIDIEEHARVRASEDNNRADTEARALSSLLIMQIYCK